MSHRQLPQWVQERRAEGYGGVIRMPADMKEGWFLGMVDSGMPFCLLEGASVVAFYLGDDVAAFWNEYAPQGVVCQRLMPDDGAEVVCLPRFTS